jgi:hypothetical protein
MSKIHKPSHNSTLANSEADKDLLDVIDSGSDEEDKEKITDY